MFDNLFFELLLRFWRPLVFAVVVDMAAQVWFESSGLGVVAPAVIGGFAFAEGVHLFDSRHRARRGLPRRSRLAMVGSTVALCVIPGVVLALGFMTGRHFPS